MTLVTGAQFPLVGLSMWAVTGGKERPLSAAEQLFASGLGGAISGLICGPLGAFDGRRRPKGRGEGGTIDTLDPSPADSGPPPRAEMCMILQQRRGTSLGQTPRLIRKEVGTVGFVRGMPMAATREALFTVGYLGAVPRMTACEGGISAPSTAGSN